MFRVYLELGFDHILDLQGFDHIVFLIALCAAYSYKQWKKILILVTAFTLGHSLTLALSALDIVTINADLIELLIPVTILLTAVFNLVVLDKMQGDWRLHYMLPLLFGFIHGMGFSNFFKAMMGRASDIITPLFAFNIGVEIGQIVIVVIIMLLNWLLIGVLRMQQRFWRVSVSILAGALSVYMIVNKLIE